MYYQNIKTEDASNIPGCTAILDSIEKRWAKADQDVFVVAVILNPFVKTSAFSPQLPFLTLAGVLSLLTRLYKCFFSPMETAEQLAANTQLLFSNVQDYFSGKGICADMASFSNSIDNDARSNGESPDPLSVYAGISPISRTTLPPLFKLAYHILSICPNSASCERLFSVFGNTLTKLRNRLGNQTLTSLAELKMHICDEHLRTGETKQRMKRFFGKANDAPTPSAQPVSLTPPLATIETEADVNVTPMDMDIDPTLEQSQDSLSNEFNLLTSSFGRQASGDGDDGDGLPSSISTKITELFDFNNQAWISLNDRSASRSLEEELELYELIDKDAGGADDINIEIDPALDSLLHHV
jgi:hypothetical protein